MIKLRGVIQVTGPHGVGKSLFALQYGDLTKTCLLDDDIKGRSTVDEVNEILARQDKEFGRYIDVIKMLENTPMSYERYKILDKLIDGLSKYETIIIDTWSQWGNICREYAKHHPEAFRKPLENRSGKLNYRSGNSQIMQGEISADGRILEEIWINKLREKCDLLFLITHLKPFYKNNVDTNKEVPIQSKVLDRVCDARIWIRQNPQSAVPIGLVIKRLAVNEIANDGKLKTINFLPQKLTPKPDDTSLWDVIDWYYQPENRMGNRTPEAHETPDQVEMSILENTLTNEQMRIYEYGVRAVNGLSRMDQQETTSDAQEAMIAAIREKKSQGMAPPMILEALKSQYPDLKIPMIIGVN